MDASLVKRDPEIMSGALCFTGTRVPVKNLFDYLEEILAKLVKGSYVLVTADA